MAQYQGSPGWIFMRSQGVAFGWFRLRRSIWDRMKRIAEDVPKFIGDQNRLPITQKLNPGGFFGQFSCAIDGSVAFLCTYNLRRTYLELRSWSPSIFHTFRTLSSPLVARCTSDVSTAAHRTCPDFRISSFAPLSNLAVECSTSPVLDVEIRSKRQIKTIISYTLSPEPEYEVLILPLSVMFQETNENEGKWTWEWLVNTKGKP
jgi:hypothetical protein